MNTRVADREPYPNPVVRLLDATKVSQASFIRQMRIAKQTVNALTTGKSTTVSDRMSAMIGKWCHDKQVPAKQILEEEYDGMGLNEAYQQWRRRCRFTLQGTLDGVRVPKDTGNLSPFYYFVKDVGLSTQAFCKIYKVQTSVLQDVVLGKAVNVPSDLRQALEDVDYPFREELSDAYTSWKASQ